MESNGCSKINKFVSKIFFLNLEISCLKVPTPMQFTAVNFDEKFYLDAVCVSDQKKIAYFSSYHTYNTTKFLGWQLNATSKTRGKCASLHRIYGCLQSSAPYAPQNRSVRPEITTNRKSYIIAFKCRRNYSIISSEQRERAFLNSHR